MYELTVREIENLCNKEKENLEYYNDESGEWKDYNFNDFRKGGGFPDPTNADYPITAITICDVEQNKYFTFGLHGYETELTEELGEDEIEYMEIPDESELIQRVIEFLHIESPDVITGWNISANKKLNIPGFDLPYIINRSKKILGKHNFKRMSPVNRVRYRKNEDTGGHEVDIEGVSIVDYLAAYKWYTRKNPESYTLGYISTMELGKGKVDYQNYGSLKNLFHENWNLYIDYNIVDTKRIKELEDKLGYIKLVQSFSLISKCPMKYFTSMVTLLEGKMLCHYRRNKMCAPKVQNGQREPYPAAYVKEPVTGFCRWVFSIDIKSSYPTAIITLNMSNETYIGKIISFDEDDIIRYTCKREFPEFRLSNYKTSEIKEVKGKQLDNFNKMLQRGMICIAPAGVCFKTKPEGVVTCVEREMFEKRQQMKQLMRETDDKVLKSQYNTFQNSLKILINSFYGIMAYPYGNRYFNPHIAAAVTSCGRHAVKQGEIFSNRLLNNPNDNLKQIIKELQ